MNFRGDAEWLNLCIEKLDKDAEISAVYKYISSLIFDPYHQKVLIVQQRHFPLTVALVFHALKLCKMLVLCPTKNIQHKLKKEINGSLTDLEAQKRDFLLHCICISECVNVLDTKNNAGSSISLAYYKPSTDLAVLDGEEMSIPQDMKIWFEAIIVIDAEKYTAVQRKYISAMCAPGCPVIYLTHETPKMLDLFKKI